MQKFSNMPLSEVASAAVPAARRVAVPTAKPASLSAEALNIPRSGIRDVFDRVERVPDAISLTVGEPSATAAPHIVAAACEAAQAGRTRYTNVLGVPEYRKAVADYSARVKGLTYDPETEIQAVDGATIGLFLALKAVVGTGDEVIIPSPFFTSYDAEVMLCGGRPVTVALRPEHGMRVNAADIEAAITPAHPRRNHQLTRQSDRRGNFCRRTGAYCRSMQAAQYLGHLRRGLPSVRVWGNVRGNAWGRGSRGTIDCRGAGHERPHHCGGKPVENLRDDRLAHRLPAGTRSGHRTDR